MGKRHLSRRQFLARGGRLALGVAGMAGLPALAFATAARDVVSVVRIRNGKVEAAVEEAIELLGGMPTLTRGKERILLKPNLVRDQPFPTTKPEVVATLARLMKDAGKDVSIGEGSSSIAGFNMVGREEFRTRKVSVLEPMQRHVFDRLGYTELARRIGIPLVNLHVGEMATVPVPGGLAYPEVQLHRSLVDTDLVCSVPMMKTHALATVSLGMKNLMGLYAGTVYGTVRAEVHSHAADRGSPGVAYEILDMVRANKLGLVVVDATKAMEGNGPVDGHVVDMGLIIAGTNPLATDMVSASVMGIDPGEVPTFTVAHRIGMTPTRLEQIEIRGAPLGQVRQRFVRPMMASWNQIRSFLGAREL
jgi:uncharacterized protein (DUF362 family)